VVYYQANPLPNWGPGSRAKSLKTTSAISVAKEAGKREVAGEMDGPRKKVKVDSEDGIEGDVAMNG
jgi:hypothetical protein